MASKKAPAPPTGGVLSDLVGTDVAESPEDLARMGDLLKKIQKQAAEEQPEEKVQSRLARKLPHDGEEFWIVLCPRCNGEAIYLTKDPRDQFVDTGDWGAAYKNFGSPWAHQMIPCQKCLERDTIAPIRCTFPPQTGGDGALEVSKGVFLDLKGQDQGFTIAGAETRFVTTRTYQEERRRVAQAEREAQNVRREITREAARKAQL